MPTRGILRLLLLCGAALCLSACSTIKSWFPDKQKEYRYSSEIPPLEIPPDLAGSSLGVEPPEQPEVTESATTAVPQQIASAPREDTIGRQPPAPEGVEQTAELIRDEKGAHIHIEASFAESWTMVEKALNRLSVEIKDRDRSQKIFYVYFSGEVRKTPERSWMSDLRYMITGSTGGGDGEQEYRVHLESAADTLTKIRVADASGQFQTEGDGLKLLQALYERIRNLSVEDDKKAREVPAREEGEPAPVEGSGAGNSR